MEDYGLSSYKQWSEQRGEEWMASILEKYPIKDFSVANDEN